MIACSSLAFCFHLRQRDQNVNSTLHSVEEKYPELAKKMSCVQTGYFMSSYKLAPAAYFFKVSCYSISISPIQIMSVLILEEYETSEMHLVLVLQLEARQKSPPRPKDASQSISFFPPPPHIPDSPLPPLTATQQHLHPILPDPRLRSRPSPRRQRRPRHLCPRRRPNGPRQALHGRRHDLQLGRLRRYLVEGHGQGSEL